MLAEPDELLQIVVPDVGTKLPLRVRPSVDAVRVKVIDVVIIVTLNPLRTESPRIAELTTQLGSSGSNSTIKLPVSVPPAS